MAITKPMQETERLDQLADRIETIVSLHGPSNPSRSRIKNHKMKISVCRRSSILTESQFYGDSAKRYCFHLCFGIWIVLVVCIPHVRKKLKKNKPNVSSSQSSQTRRTESPSLATSRDCTLPTELQRESTTAR